MAEKDLLQQAISAARAGRELTARDIFLEIVERDPQNETAWMWLTGLLDDPEDCIYACEQTLAINPHNQGVRDYLTKLLAEKQQKLDAEQKQIEGQLQHIRDLAKAGQREKALQLTRALTQENQTGADGWKLLAELAPDINEQIHALENLSKLNPKDAEVQQQLQRLRHFQQDPLDLAAMYEEKGELDKAIATYGLAAAKPISKAQWESIYWKIIKLENQRQENIAHISPGLSVARLTGGPALLYLMLMLIQVGINPFASPQPFLWLGLPWVLLGGFMIALASVRSHHRLWFILFKDVGSGGSPSARFAMAAAGWTLVLLPHLMLFFVALGQLLHITG